MTYLPRLADPALAELLGAMGGVVVEGPRGCGKTTTSLQHATSHVRLDSGPAVLELAELQPLLLLEGKTPRLIDEWQLAPEIWNVVRHEIDERAQPGQFILSGSAQPPKDLTRHSGAGRIGRLRMRTMALCESGHSTSAVNLDELLGGTAISGMSAVTYRELAELCVIGGWPALTNSDHRQAIAFNRSYLDDLYAQNIPLATGVRHSPLRMRRLVEAIARNTATEVSIQRLAQDVSADGGELDPTTIRRYLDALTSVFILDELPAWSIALRSKSRLRTSAKLNLADPSLACAALGITADRLAADPEFFGQVFESMVTRDIRSMVEARFGRVYHYRDNTGLEIDLILEFEDGTWAAIEVKLGESRIERAEKNLLTLRDSRVDTERVGIPAFLAIVTAGTYASTRPSGVHVLPLGALGT